MSIDMKKIARKDYVEVGTMPAVGSHVPGSHTRTIMGGSSMFSTRFKFEVLGVRFDAMSLVVKVTDPSVQAHDTFESDYFVESYGGPPLMDGAFVGHRTWVVYEGDILGHFPAGSLLTVAKDPAISPSCDNCGQPNVYGAPANRLNGEFHCYPCRQDPIIRRGFKTR